MDIFHRAGWCAVIAAFVIASGLARAEGAASPRVKQDKRTVTICAGERPLVEYRHGDVPFKPYVAELYSPSGVQILRDSPHDHKHHHALMFALKADGVDFWSEVPTAGSQKSQAKLQVRTVARDGGARGELVDRLIWTEPEAGRTVLTERREITAECRNGPRPVTLLTWRSQLAVPPGKKPVELAGSHYFGLGMRFIESMDKDGRFLFSTQKPGETVRGTEQLTPSRWCAYAAKADGKPVTVAIFDHPGNPRHPNKMFTMTQPFAYLSATLNLWKEPMELETSRPLALCYGVALWDGTVQPAEVESLYRQWVAETTRPPSGVSPE